MLHRSWSCHRLRGGGLVAVSCCVGGRIRFFRLLVDIGRLIELTHSRGEQRHGQKRAASQQRSSGVSSGSKCSPPRQHPSPACRQQLQLQGRRPAFINRVCSAARRYRGANPALAPSRPSRRNLRLSSYHRRQRALSCSIIRRLAARRLCATPHCCQCRSCFCLILLRGNPFLSIWQLLSPRLP